MREVARSNSSVLGKKSGKQSGKYFPLCWEVKCQFDFHIELEPFPAECRYGVTTQWNHEDTKGKAQFSSCSRVLERFLLKEE